MIKNKLYILAITPLLLTGCDLTSSAANFKEKSQHERAVHKAERLLKSGSLAYAKNPDSAIHVYEPTAVGDGDKEIESCFEKDAICFSTGATDTNLGMYHQQIPILVTGSNDCTDEWGVQLDLAVRYIKTNPNSSQAEIAATASDLWEGYSNKSFLESLVFDDQLYTDSGVIASIKEPTSISVRSSILADDVKQFNAYLKGFNNERLSAEVNKALVESYANPHRDAIEGLSNKIRNDIQAELPNIDVTDIQVSGFTVGGRVDNGFVLDNDYIKKSFSCQV